MSDGWRSCCDWLEVVIVVEIIIANKNTGQTITGPELEQLCVNGAPGGAPVLCCI